MHSYAGNPNNFPSAINVIDDSDPPNASNFNAAVEGNRDAIVSLAGLVGGNWRPSFLGTSIASGFVIQGACWNASQSKWGVVGQVSSDLVAYSSTGADDGNNAYWFSQGFHTTPNTNLGASIAADPSGNFWVASLDNSSNLTVQEEGASSVARTLATGSGVDVQITVYNNRLITAVSCGVSNLFKISSASLSSPTSWSDFTDQNINASILKTDGSSVVIAMPYGANLATGVYYYTSTDGLSWNPRSLATLLPVSTNTVQGLCYSPIAGQWFALVSATGSGSNCQVFATATPTSPTSWVALQGSAMSLPGVDLAALGLRVVATEADQGSTGPSYSAFSNDGGVTWHPAQQSFASNNASSGTPYTRSRYAQGDTGLFAFNSLWGRFSLVEGIPSKSL